MFQTKIIPRRILYKKVSIQIFPNCITNVQGWVGCNETLFSTVGNMRENKKFSTIILSPTDLSKQKGCKLIPYTYVFYISINPSLEFFLSSPPYHRYTFWNSWFLVISSIRSEFLSQFFLNIHQPESSNWYIEKRSRSQNPILVYCSMYQEGAGLWNF